MCMGGLLRLKLVGELDKMSDVVSLRLLYNFGRLPLKSLNC